MRPFVELFLHLRQGMIASGDHARRTLHADWGCCSCGLRWGCFAVIKVEEAQGRRSFCRRPGSLSMTPCCCQADGRYTCRSQIKPFG